jgi:hypothetical protein
MFGPLFADSAYVSDAKTTCAKVPTVWRFNFSQIFSETCLQAVVIGVEWRIETVDPLHANRKLNHIRSRTQNRTRVDGPIATFVAL